LPRFLSGWVKAKKVALADELDVFDLADIFQGRTIADIEGALQYALNKAIADHGGEGRLQITREHVKAASRVVLAA
jgi:SpoVK/Ycf46/Vps4 family AAA+-type ATPase